MDAIEVEALDLPSDYTTLSDLEQTALQAWIRLAIRPARRYHRSTSYGLKHHFEKVGFYITNGAFKGAMQAAGYAPRTPTARNWEFKIRLRPSAPTPAHVDFVQRVQRVRATDPPVGPTAVSPGTAADCGRSTYE